MSWKNYNSEEQKNWSVYIITNKYSGYKQIYCTRKGLEYEINYSIFNNHNYSQEDWTIARQRLVYDYFYYGKDSFEVKIIIENVYKKDAEEIRDEERKKIIEGINKNYNLFALYSYRFPKEFGYYNKALNIDIKVYLIMNRENGKWYIGATTDEINRYRTWFSVAMKENSHLFEIITLERFIGLKNEIKVENKLIVNPLISTFKEGKYKYNTKNSINGNVKIIGLKYAISWFLRLYFYGLDINKYYSKHISAYEIEYIMNIIPFVKDNYLYTNEEELIENIIDCLNSKYYKRLLINMNRTNKNTWYIYEMYCKKANLYYIGYANNVYNRFYSHFYYDKMLGGYTKEFWTIKTIYTFEDDKKFEGYTHFEIEAWFTCYYYLSGKQICNLRFGSFLKSNVDKIINEIKGLDIEDTCYQLVDILSEHAKKNDRSKKDKLWRIYCITNKINGKKYIGKCFGSLKIRFRSHTTGNGHLNYMLEEANLDKEMHEHPENFTIEELFTTPYSDNINQIEEKITREYAKKYELYNKKYGDAFLEETKLKISLSKIKNPVYCCDTQQVYLSAGRAAEELGLKKYLIRYCCDGTREYYNGMKWKYWSALTEEERKNAKFDYIEISKEEFLKLFL